METLRELILPGGGAVAMVFLSIRSAAFCELLIVLFIQSVFFGRLDIFAACRVLRLQHVLSTC
jgi:hypothetical protein